MRTHYEGHNLPTLKQLGFHCRREKFNISSNIHQERRAKRERNQNAAQDEDESGKEEAGDSEDDPDVPPPEMGEQQFHVEEVHL